jgi:hypothetical protein
MPIERQPRPDSVNLRFAEYLDGQKQAIIGEWLQSVRADATILPPQFLDEMAITNLLPSLLDDLNATLRHLGSILVADQALRDARKHGATRSTQGYVRCEALREIKHFRSLLIRHLRNFENIHPGYALVAMLFVSTIVHRFLDELTINAAHGFRAA